jgi:gliding motility-associated-like protein
MVSATFNKAMNTATAGSIAIKLGGATVGSVSAPVWSNSNQTVTFTFTGTLTYSTTYTLEIKGFGDAGGNIIDDTEYSFTTEPKPVQKVTLFVSKDYATWEMHGKVFNLRQNGEVKYTGEDNFDGTVTFQDVEDGLYRLYDGATDIRDQVVYGTTGFGISYFTVRFGVQNEGNASGSVIEAVYNGKAIANGDVIVEGKRLTLTAKGNGAATYTYFWSGSFNGNTYINFAGDAISADVLSNVVDVHCVITGTLPIPTGNLDDVTVSNLITPNGDGKNDFFFVKELDAYQSNELRIFNRSGVEVFRAINYKNNTWDGGNLVSDVYFYSLTLVNANGKVMTKTGYVHLKK